MMGFEILASLCHGLETEMGDASAALTAAQLEPLRRRWTSSARAGAVPGRSRPRHRRAVGARDRRLARDVEAGVPSFQVLQRLAAWKLEPAERPLGRLASFARALAKRLGKGDLEVEVAGQGVRLDPDKWAGLWSQLAHVVRNAVDHGIETPAARRERRKAGGPAAAAGHVGPRRRAHRRVEDDGAGVDWESVRASAQQRGLPHATRADLTDALFASGITTRNNVTRISGRGVGLASIRNYVEERRADA